MNPQSSYPAQYEVQPLSGQPHVSVSVPGSKSITNRALVLAALAPRCVVTNALRSDDTEVMVDCLTRLGWDVRADWPSCAIHVARPVGADLIPAAQAELFVGNSGTTIRFLTALVSLGRGRYRLDGVPRMRERPIGDLLDALEQLGVSAVSEHANGCPPVVIESQGLQGGDVRLRTNLSSQFFSGLLMALPFANADSTITLVGEMVSQPYVDMTLAMMGSIGLQVTTEAGLVRVPGRQSWAGGAIAVEPDASSASYFWAASAITGGTVTVRQLTKQSLQGDVAFVDELARMGCVVEPTADGIRVTGRPLRGIDTDMNAISDTVMTLAAVACFADGPTTIRNVGHIRHKETDRLAALATELRKVGAEIEEWPDGLRITPRPLHGAVIHTYDDHRMAMSMALIGLRVPGVVIDQPSCVAKTYPDFFRDLERLRSQG